MPPVDKRPCRKKTGKCLLIILKLLYLNGKTDIKFSTSQPLRGISILKQAIDKMQMNTNQLTSVHADLCQVSMKAEQLKSCEKSVGCYLVIVKGIVHPKNATGPSTNACFFIRF